VQLAQDHDQLVLIHTPHLEDKLKGTKIDRGGAEELPEGSTRSA
jgi:predicted metal-dependent TIM-barrel fold hydrolase